MTDTCDVADGLRRLADLYDAHPNLPAPHIILSITRHDPNAAARVAAFVDGLDSIDDLHLAPSPISFLTEASRQFGGLTVKANIDSELVTTERDVMRETTERVPLTLDVIRARATVAVA